MVCGDACCGSSPAPDQRDQSEMGADNEPTPVATPTENGGCAASGCCPSKKPEAKGATLAANSEDCVKSYGRVGDCCKPANESQEDLKCCAEGDLKVAQARSPVDLSGGITNNVDEGNQGDSCCGDGVQLPSGETDGSCGSKKPKSSETCCSEGPSPRVEPSDGFCGSKQSAEAEAGTCCTSESKLAVSVCSVGARQCPKVSCCPPPKPTNDCCGPTEKVVLVSRDMAEAPDCCKGKTSPCCDEECIERIALRECQSATADSVMSFDKDCKQGKDGKPCKSHARSARTRYQSRLEALGCICRALIARGQESCCPSTPRIGFSKRPTSLKSRSSISTTPLSSVAKTEKRRDMVPSARLKKCEQSGLPTQVSLGCSKGCCEYPNKEILQEVKSCADASCNSLPPGKAITPSHCGADVSHLRDMEKRGGASKEHIVIAISGMTCTGCETKLQRTLGNLKTVVNLKTSLVLSRVEFDLDPGELSAEDVIKHLERTTEFKCDKINTLTSTLDLSCDSGGSDLVNGPWPKGVTNMNLVDKGTILRVDFDSTLVGARDLVDKGWDRPMKLAPSRLDPGLEAGSKHVRHMGLMMLLSICLTIPVLIMAWAPLPDRELAYSSASLALATIVQSVVAGPFYPKALKSLIFSRIIEMDLLIVLSTSAAYIFSVVSFGYLVAGQPLSTGEFFETSTLLVTLIMVGRYVAALARQKAVESISIRSLQTSTATVIDASGADRLIDTRLLQLGDVFKVAPESKVPTDGTVISGHSEIDESMLTGESIPVEKNAGSIVIAGSINGSGSLTIRLTRLPENNTISTIASMVDEAKLSKPKIQEFADQVASYFVPVIIGLTLITFAIWIAVGVAVRGQPGREATIHAVTYAITVLIVSCPCAIGLAVPMVIVIATGMAAERGIIFKSSQSIEVAYKTSHVVFDKTGTLTAGKLTVCEQHVSDEHVSTTFAMLLGLIQENKHPVSVAVASYLDKKDVTASSILDAKVLAGKGVEGTYQGMNLRAGNSRWLNTASLPEVTNMLSNGYTVFCFTVNGTLTAVFGLKDEVRPDAAATISELQIKGIDVHLLSGDDDGAVQSAASTLRIPYDKVKSRCSPADKQDYIKALTNSITTSSDKIKNPVVAFCGDGTNDAVALAGATIGIHMNGGTDVAQSAADIVLVRPELSRILTVISLSRKSIHRIAFNFGWSFVYNLFAILLASGAFVNARIPPEYAGLGELASVLPVIAAAALLRWSKI